jgi:serine/threonine protein kinase
MALAPGTRLGPYEIIAPLGARGMGEVYRALDLRLDRTVAIKILPQQFADDPARRERFEREAKAVAALSHPNILAIHDVGTDALTPGSPVIYAVTELLEGETPASVSPPIRRLRARLWRSRSRSPAVWLRRTKKESSTATSSRRTSSSRPTGG